MGTKVKYLSDPSGFSVKESLYLKVREREDRLLSDEQVLGLPGKSPVPDLTNEWKIRATSYVRLVKLLRKMRPLRVLDVGTGNGWLIGKLCKKFKETQFIGVDVNVTELEQAARLFGNERVEFLYSDPLGNELQSIEKVDVILFNASIQYFQDIPALMARMKKLLRRSGVIIINDSPVYQNSSLAFEATIRSSDYYSNLGFPEMNKFYFPVNVYDLLSEGFNEVRPWILKIFRPNQLFPVYLYRNNENG